MMFRLNFLVVIVMAVTNNEFVRYYVCAMHTYWFLTVYVMMAVFKSYNEVNRKDRPVIRAESITHRFANKRQVQGDKRKNNRRKIFLVSWKQWLKGLKNSPDVSL